MATTIKIDGALNERIDKLATLRHRSPAAIMREAIEQYIEREEARESFKQEALDSWAQYHKAGQHLTGEEVRAWLNNWGENDDAAPDCHA